MPELAAECEKLIAELTLDLAPGRSADSRAFAVVWSADGASRLWQSEAAAEAGLAEPDAESPPELREALRALAGGLAPRSGFRVVALPPLPGGGASADDAPQLYACRRAHLDGEEALATLRIDAPGSSEPVAASPSGPLVAIRSRRPVRFTWSMDEAGRFTAVSPELADLVGPHHAGVVGRRWDELAARLVLDEDGSVPRALEGRSPWSGRAVLWRLGDDGANAVPVDLGAMPVFGSDRAFAGFRGYGLARPEAARTVPPPPAETPANELVPLPGRPVVAAEALTVDSWSAALVSVASRLVPAWSTLGFGRPDTANDAVATLPAPETAAALSTSERGALSEIARVLGARIEAPEAAPEPDGEPRSSAEVVYMPAPRGRDPDQSRLLDRLPIGLAVLRDMVPVYANRPLLELAGADDLPQLVARGGFDAMFGTGFAEAFPGGEGTARLPLVAGEGGNRPVDVRLSGLTWGDLPATLASVQTVQDDDLHRRLESLGVELAAAEAKVTRLRGELDVAADGVVTLDRSGRILAVSAAAGRLFGYAENEIVGEPVAVLLVVDEHPATLDALARAWSTAVPGEPEREVRGRARDGTVLPLLMRAARVNGGDEAFVTVALRDGERHRQIERQLLEVQRAAEQASARQVDFLARVSHEIRTPLNAIIGFAELMLEERFGAVGNERYKGYLRDIQGSGNHVLSLVNDLLDLAKITSRQHELVPTSVDLNEITRQGVAITAPLATRERAILRTSLGPALPRVVADERSLRQIVLNLLSNAIRFTGAGGQVIVSTAVSDLGQAVLRVRDTGPGMSPQEVEAALMPFRQVSSTRRNDGTGLGLPLSKALVEANGGSFVIGSAPGSGTLVEIRLPTMGRGEIASAAE